VNPASYDTIARTYTATRRPDFRVAARTLHALGDARDVVNVGAGGWCIRTPRPSGYRDRALEDDDPAARTGGGCRAPGLGRSDPARRPERRGGAGDPHRPSLERHGARIRRDPARRQTARRVPHLRPCVPRLVADPGLLPGDPDSRPCAPLRAFRALGLVECSIVPVPSDCTDGFLAAFWRRPESYLDPRLRENISSFAQLTRAVLEPGLVRLERDLASDVWKRRYTAPRAFGELDCGYRLVTCELAPDV
jgi:hypothetical protein